MAIERFGIIRMPLRQIENPQICAIGRSDGKPCPHLSVRLRHEENGNITIIHACQRRDDNCDNLAYRQLWFGMPLS